MWFVFCGMICMFPNKLILILILRSLLKKLFGNNLHFTMICSKTY